MFYKIDLLGTHTKTTSVIAPCFSKIFTVNDEYVLRIKSYQDFAK